MERSRDLLKVVDQEEPNRSMKKERVMIARGREKTVMVICFERARERMTKRRKEKSQCSPLVVY